MIGKTFEGHKLALFRVLGQTIATLPKHRHQAHLQGLLNISNAALNNPLTVNWQSKIYINDEWTTTNNQITIEGPLPGDKEDSVDIIEVEPRHPIKRKCQEDDDAF